MQHLSSQTPAKQNSAAYSRLRDNPDLIKSIIAGLLMLLAIRWVLFCLIPITLLEVKYRYRSTLNSLFHVSSLSELVIPDFNWFDPIEVSKYRQYGIRIPSIYLDEPVVFNVDPHNFREYRSALNQGIAHASSTAIPDEGNIGYYFAHSSSPELVARYNAVFYLLGKIEEGDEVIIWHDNQKYEYQVYSKKITKPNDVNFLQNSYQQESIVLQTCWPPGTNSRRLLVFAERK